MSEDLIIFQEIVYNTQPDLIIETGVAREVLLFFGPQSRNYVVSLDKFSVWIYIREYARNAMNNSNFKSEINLIGGSSVENKVVDSVQSIISQHERIIVVLDSNHTHENILSEPEIYSKFVSKDCFLIVLDTVINDKNRQIDLGIHDQALSLL